MLARGINSCEKSVFCQKCKPSFCRLLYKNCETAVNTSGLGTLRRLRRDQRVSHGLGFRGLGFGLYEISRGNRTPVEDGTLVD